MAKTHFSPTHHLHHKNSSFIKNKIFFFSQQPPFWLDPCHAKREWNVSKSFTSTELSSFRTHRKICLSLTGKDLLSANVKIFKAQGEAIDKHAKKDIKVLVVGNPANTNAFICSHYAPSIPRENFTAMTRLDQNRAQAHVASKVGVPVEAVQNVIIWGNHSATQFPDVKHATVRVGTTEKAVYDAINDTQYLQTDFVTTIQKRGAAVIAARKMV